MCGPSRTRRTYNKRLIPYIVVCCKVLYNSSQTTTYHHDFYIYGFFVDGKTKATSFDAKYIETSCVLKHNVDELLVGVTKQILLRKQKTEKGVDSNPIDVSSGSRKVIFKNDI